MTKTEQKILDRVREINDAGGLASFFQAVAETKGTYDSRRRGYSNRKPIKAEQEAYDRLVERGDLVSPPGYGGNAIPGHPLLRSFAIEIEADLPRRQEVLAKMRAEAHEYELHLQQAREFIRRQVGVDPAK